MPIQHPWLRLPLVLLATTCLWAAYAPAPKVKVVASPVQVSQRQQGWDALLKVARLVNANQQVTDLVLQLDVLDKPETSYANAVYQVFARIDGDWKAIYTNTGARLIRRDAGRITLEPEVIPISVLQAELADKNTRLDETALRVLTLIRYDIPGGQRDQRVEFEQVEGYSVISQTQTTQLFRVIDRLAISKNMAGAYEEAVVLFNGYRVKFLGVSYSGSSSTWRYSLDKLAIAQGLQEWELELPGCARVTSVSGGGEVIKKSRSSLVKWQPGQAFSQGEFQVTVADELPIGVTEVAVKAPGKETVDLAGPACQ